jgi:hypothetical protein
MASALMPRSLAFEARTAMGAALTVAGVGLLLVT